jgi:hypothetical protein
VDTSFPQKAGCVDGTSIIAIRSSFLPYANRYKSKTRLRLAVSPIPVDRKPQRSAGIDLMHAVIALPIPIIFFSATALLVIALPTHLGAGVREAGEDVQQPCDTAEGCGLGKIT